MPVALRRPCCWFAGCRNPAFVTLCPDSPLVSELFPAFCCAVHQLVSPVMEMESELVL